jgi:hypothetical protein
VWQRTTHSRIRSVGSEKLLSVLRTLGERHGCGSVEEAHKQAKHKPVSDLVKRVEETLVAGVVVVHTSDVIWLALDGGAIGCFVDGLWKRVVVTPISTL